MKEIGGYIELDRHSGGLLHDNAVALNCGRAALEYLLETRNIRKICIPFFSCDSIAEPCRKRGVELEYYHVGESLRPEFNRELEQDEWLYIVNYYGQLTLNELEEYKRRFERVIADNTQAYFQMPAAGMDTLYSCRKYFGVSDGAFLYTDKPLERELPVDESFRRVGYVLGRFERSAGEFFAEACANNDFFSGQALKRMSRLTDNLLRAVDYTAVSAKRTDNFAFLHSRLSKVNRLCLTVPQGAFMYPLYLPHGGELRKAMQREKIFVPTLWPDVFSLCKKGSVEYDMAENILPLPIDQRYGPDDMEYICEVLENVQTARA